MWGPTDDEWKFIKWMFIIGLVATVLFIVVGCPLALIWFFNHVTVGVR
jgi:ABC-type dipeptide/oligopeptide/nickel transport system permease component